ncbi:MAG: hypothetical protein C0417_01935 [Chlorobiaceae bacterium]|nr:hypothetical protein [Chlorobiaceae bacterium]
MIIVYIIAGIITLFILLQLIVQLRAKFRTGKKIDNLPGHIGDIVRQGAKVLLYFYSPNCGSCKTQTPVIDEMARDTKNIYKVDVSRDLKTAMILGVMGTPSTVIIESGIVKKYFIGYKNKQTLLKFFS